MRRAASLTLAAVLAAGSGQAQDLPPLPEGLGGPSPEILAAAPAPEPPEATAAPGGFSVTGFGEALYARRLRDDPRQDDATLSELRLHIEARTGEALRFTFAADLVADDVVARGTDLRTGEGPVDLREAHVFFRPAPFADIRAGRQILTWGTGDLIFVNDPFPKDFESFFAGRDDDYLKAPVDALKVSLFSDLANLDLVLMAPGQTDRYVDGARLSYADHVTGELTDQVRKRDRPDDPALAARVFRTFGSLEAALYGYHGHWTSPMELTGDGRLSFPDLRSFGVSLRGPLWGGIAYAESARAMSEGLDETRLLLGHEREIAHETTLGAQFLTTRFDRGGKRDLATLRLTRLFRSQTISASAILFHSPEDSDGFVRARASVALNDTVSLNATVTHFYGGADTPFGQLDRASHIGAALRISF